MLQPEVLVLEAGAVDADAARAVSFGDVASLEHEVLDDPVELAACVGQHLSVVEDALRQGLEVLHSFGHHISEQTYDYPPHRLPSYLDVEIDFVCDQHGLSSSVGVGG